MFIQIPSHVIMEMRRRSILLENEILGILFKLWHQPILEHVKIRMTPYRLFCNEKRRKRIHSFLDFFIVPPLPRDQVELRGWISNEFANVTREHVGASLNVNGVSPRYLPCSAHIKCLLGTTSKQKKL
ncbi:hypothetical protein TNCV_1812531 [Trichonephila clavipes]|uniref:Uncharacterized protein n=1 Tax=Trichonephila clavipes TaxID=2585209 RepID=A0A8X7BFW5_TRICX|nr:hypothetical protein TNCV_1812531 [Trichonephila clavipes]